MLLTIFRFKSNFNSEPHMPQAFKLTIQVTSRWDAETSRSVAQSRIVRNNSNDDKSK